MSNEPNKPGDAQPPPSAPSDAQPLPAFLLPLTPIPYEEEKPQELRTAEFVAAVSPEAPPAAPPSDPELAARLRATLQGQPSAPPSDQPVPVVADKFPLEPTPLSPLAIVGVVSSALGLILCVFWLMSPGKIVLNNKQPGIVSPIAVEQKIAPPAAKEPAVAGERTELAIGEDKVLSPPPLKLLPPAAKDKAITKSAKQAKAHAPRKRYYPRYRRRYQDDGAWF